MTYEVGKIVENFKNHNEGVQFNIADDGAALLVFFNNPTENEIKQFESGNKFEIRFTELYGVIMLTVKIGNLNWMDAPYSPHLSKNLTKLQAVGKESGLALNIMFVDAITGEIKHIRLVGLSERFTKKLFKVVKEQMDKDFNAIKYQATINRIYSNYPTEMIANMSNCYCKIQ